MSMFAWPRRGERRAWRQDLPVGLIALSLLLLAAAAAPLGQRWWARAQVTRRVATMVSPRQPLCPALSLPASVAAAGLASWQTIGGCGAGASTGVGGGIRWIGRGVTGGAFDSQCMVSYTRLDPDPQRPEHHVFGNALVTTKAGDRWSFGANVPLVYKYMRNPLLNGADLSNGGLGDVSVLLARKFGAIRATTVTASAGIPTGEYNGQYKMRILNQSQQRGFGKPTASLQLDHVGDEIWGLTLVGASAGWRGGQNKVDNYRAPSASAYSYVGYFLGPLVPAVGLTLTGLTGHDRDQTVEQYTGLYIATPSVSLEWSTDWVAFLVGAAFPYQYDGFDRTTEGRPRTPYGWGPWMVGMGLAFSPF
jgi:hypothetical protein